MRCSGWSSLAISACSASALILAAPAAAHVTVVPAFVSAGDTGTLSLTAPNERDVAMTGFDITVPSEFRIVHAHPADGWHSSVRGSTAIWTEGSLAPGAEATFSLQVEGPTAPGDAGKDAREAVMSPLAVRCWHEVNTELKLLAIHELRSD